MKRYCLALDLKDDPALIAEYEHWHKSENIWHEIKNGISDSGITSMEIYRVHNRLFMIMETEDDFDLDQKVKADAANPKAQEWETFMWKFQQSLPWANPGEKWVLMHKIFDLK